ncbi:hypothetical protein [Alistipes ihumii]|uniref:hypothetical protein n=1 Tax=Alistipes ihumii TaxID=1470347 RepID=UPI003FF04B0D
MQKKTFVLFLSSFALQFLSAGEPFMFVKRVENNIDRCNLENILPDGSVEVLYNLGSKSDLERLFFDRFNAPVEFFFRPDPGMNDPRDVAGLRILKDTADNSYRIEVKRIANFKEVDDEVDKEYPYVCFRAEDMTPELFDSMIRRHIEHNDSMDTKRRQERMKRYRVETKSFRIGQQLADALYDRITDMIEHFDSRYEGRYAAYSVTFRCVVGNEVWTLFFRDVPQGETLALSDLCMRMLRDAKTDDWAEAEYLNLLSR